MEQLVKSRWTCSRLREFPTQLNCHSWWWFGLFGILICLLSHLYTQLTEGQVQKALEKLMLKHKLISSMIMVVILQIHFKILTRSSWKFYKQNSYIAHSQMSQVFWKTNAKKEKSKMITSNLSFHWLRINSTHTCNEEKMASWNFAYFHHLEMIFFPMNISPVVFLVLWSKMPFIFESFMYSLDAPKPIYINVVNEINYKLH